MAGNALPLAAAPPPGPRSDTARVPYAVFVDPAVYAAEQARVFRGPTWNFVGLAAEVPQPGDFRTSFIGDTPVVLTRSRDGALHCWVNRCAHRGALVCREPRGNRLSHVCAYHQWAFDLTGRLRGVPFAEGLGGRGGTPADFDMNAHNLQRLRVASYRDLVFATFDPTPEDLSDYLGAPMRGALDTIFTRPLRVLGHSRQHAAANWKLYAENVRDPYHASLLHLFHATFGLYRSSQAGGIRMDPRRRHCVLESWREDEASEAAAMADKGLRTYRAKYALADPSLLAGWPEFRGLQILSIFPGLVVQQIQNTLAVRHLQPKGVGHFELVVTYFGYADDDAEKTATRVKQSNLIGPAGFVSMEDGHATEIVQQALQGDSAGESVLVMGGRGTEDQDNLVNEAAIRGFWQHWQELMAAPETVDG